ncbi:MAG TPA: ABC transporter permease [Bacteroidota bacterium]|nr:ABC transporter permease [Bacteroidota bacterium]
MPVSLFIAFRYLTSRRNRGFISFITFFAVVGVMLGVASLIITLSVLDGFEKTIKENLVQFTAHMQVYGFAGNMLPHPDSSLAVIRAKFPEVVVVAPYISREAMIRSDVDIDGVLVKGIDPANDISPIKTHLIAGTYDLAISDDRQQGIIIGRRLADLLEVKVGDRVLLFALGGPALSLSQARIMQFVVQAIFETGMADYDGTYVYTHLRSAERLFQVENAVTGFDILVRDVSKLPSLAHEIPLELGYPHYARTMHQMHRNLFTWIDLQKELIPIILALITLVATVNIIGTLLMMVMEKSKEIGVLKTLGSDRPTLSRIFVYQGAFIGIVGTLLGNALAYALSWAEMEYKFITLPSGIYNMTHAPIELSTWNFLLVSVVAIVLSLACSIIPARIAAKLDPMITLRFA